MCDYLQHLDSLQWQGLPSSPSESNRGTFNVESGGAHESKAEAGPLMSNWERETLLPHITHFCFPCKCHGEGTRGAVRRHRGPKCFPFGQWGRRGRPACPQRSCPVELLCHHATVTEIRIWWEANDIICGRLAAVSSL